MVEMVTLCFLSFALTRAMFTRETRGLAKLGKVVAETLLRAQMFSSLATQETLLRMQILRPRREKMFLNHVKNIFASMTQVLHPRHMFPSLAPRKHHRKQCFSNSVS